MTISFSSSGSFKRSESWLLRLTKGDIFRALDKYGRQGVNALSRATPADSGLAASSWGYEIRRSRTSWSIFWTNTNIENGFSVVIGLQYGHGTGTGGWVAGRDFINPAIKPVMDAIANDVWKAVTSG